ncbi:MAG: response regulator [Geobacteraceae bacterium]|nr:MAG: response regulator [Geobacteraceae bacterium]
MQGILIADKDMNMVAKMLGEDGYSVTITDSVSMMLQDMLKKVIKVVLLGSELDEIPAAELIPLLKKCNKKIEIILVSGEASLPQMRKVRSEGIFYHALKSNSPEDNEEIRQAVLSAMACAVKH